MCDTNSNDADRLKQAILTPAGKAPLLAAAKKFADELMAGGPAVGENAAGDSGGDAAAAANGGGAKAKLSSAEKDAAAAKKAAAAAAASGSGKSISITAKFHCRPSDIYECFTVSTLPLTGDTKGPVHCLLGLASQNPSLTLKARCAVPLAAVVQRRSAAAPLHLSTLHCHSGAPASALLPPFLTTPHLNPQTRNPYSHYTSLPIPPMRSPSQSSPSSPRPSFRNRCLTHCLFPFLLHGRCAATRSWRAAPALSPSTFTASNIIPPAPIPPRPLPSPRCPSHAHPQVEGRACAFTQSRATVQPVPGGSFSWYGGAISGTFEELAAPTRIVMRWRLNTWEDDCFSKVCAVMPWCASLSPLARMARVMGRAKSALASLQGARI